jgi:WD40 repeat protein
MEEARRPLRIEPGALLTTLVPRRRAGLLEVSPDLRWAAEAGADGPVEVWSLATGKVQARLSEGGRVEFSRQGGYLLGGEDDLTVWETEGWTQVPLPFVVPQACLSDQWLVGWAHGVHVWSLPVGDCVASLDLLTDELTPWLACCPGGRLLATCTEVLEEPHYWSTYRVEWFSLPEAHRLGELEWVRTGRRPLGLVFSECGQVLALPLRGGEVLLWNLTTGQPLPGLEVQADGFCFATPGLALVLQSERLSLWEIDSGRAVGGYLELPQTQSLRGSASHAFSSGADGVRVWDLPALVQLLSSSPGRLGLEAGKFVLSDEF